MNEVLLCILSGGVAAGLIKAIESFVTWHLNRKAAKEDKAEEKADKTQKIKEAFEKFEKGEEERNEALEKRLAQIESQNAAQSEALKLILLDRIQHLGQSYIAKGEISFDDRRRLHDMHKCYHSGLDGNGDADLVMGGVDELPLSQ